MTTETGEPERKHVRLETERLLLRPPIEADVPELVDLLQDPDMARYTLNLPYPYGEGDARGWIAKVEEGWINGTGATVVAIDKASGALVGACGLRGMKMEPELGYWIGRPYWGRGYATEACRALIALAFDHRHIDTVAASHHPDNPASGRVLDKCGFMYIGDGVFKGLRGEFPAQLFRLSRYSWERRNDG